MFAPNGLEFFMTTKTKSLLYGAVAILAWGSLATLGNRLMHLPPFYLLGVAFLLGSTPAWIKPQKMFPSLKIAVWGILGYFGYHFCLFYSFRFAPAVEANLINYLWPMLLVLFTPLFFKEIRLKYYHFVGVALSVLGCVILVSGKGAELKAENFKGYVLAFGAALLWPIYSIGKKKMGETEVWTIGGFCFGAGVLCLLTHAYLEPTVSLDPRDFLPVILMGLGPMGLAFFAWDKALAIGDARVIGALSYLTPVISTLGLVMIGGQVLTSSTAVAIALIIGGASSGLMDFFPGKALKKPDV